MKTAVFMLLLCVYESHQKDLVVGVKLNESRTYTEIVSNSAIPMEPREDEKHYSVPGHETIQGIKIQDLDKTNVDIATITAGGVGHKFVNISFKGEPGESLNYQLEIYS